MQIHNFSLDDYRESIISGSFSPPTNFCPFYEIDPVLYFKQKNSNFRWTALGKTLKEIKKRTDNDYFCKTYPLQAHTLDYSSKAFPGYRFILPEVMTEDWLAIVDWGKFQRDHVLHQPLCGYVSLKLLEGNNTAGPLYLNNGQTLLSACVEHILKWEETFYIREFLLDCGMKPDDPILDGNTQISKTTWSIFFREAAFVAAIFHDIGYPWQYAEGIKNNLDGISTPVIQQNRNAKDILEKFGHRLLFTPLRGYQKYNSASPSNWIDRIYELTDQALSKTHGFPGALGFLHLNDYLRKYPSSKGTPLQFLCVEWAAAAIMMHDMAKIYWGTKKPGFEKPENFFLRLDFAKDPLSSFIALVDVIQDFERPTVSFGKDPNGLVTLKYDKACASTQLEIDSDELTIKFIMENAQERSSKLSFLDKDQSMYFDPDFGFLNLSSLGINRVLLKAV